MIMLHNSILIWMKIWDVTDGWAVVDGGGRIFLFLAFQKKSIIQFLLKFTGAMAHQLIGNLVPYPTGSSKMYCNKILPSFRGIKFRVKINPWWKKSGLVTIAQGGILNWYLFNWVGGKPWQIPVLLGARWWPVCHNFIDIHLMNIVDYSIWT